jgi:hypothetical protein
MNKAKGANLTCAYWDATTKNWNTTGVYNGAVAETIQECLTNHLTSFAGIVASTNNTPAANNTTNPNGTGAYAMTANNYVYLLAFVILGFIGALI